MSVPSPRTRSRVRAALVAATFLLALTAPAVVARTPTGPVGPDRAPSALPAPPATDPAAGPAAAPTDADIALSVRASGLSQPVFITSARDGTGRHFIVEQSGRIKILENGAVRATPFVSLNTEVRHGSEEGLLGLAFHPDYESNRKLYVYLTNLQGNNVVREYRASASNPNVVDKRTKRRVLEISHPGQGNHNGGMIAFASNGLLYIGTGDGGGSGDAGNNAQDRNSLLGKILRINVDTRTGGRAYGIPPGNPYVGRSGLDEIWQIGLRNPWRWSFDRANGDLWIGDVGQGKWEEIDRAKKTSTGPGKGLNWGWRVMEGNHCYLPSSGCSTSGKTRPVTEYNHAGGRCAVSGGYVYRGTSIPALYGGYVFADFCTGEIWVVNATAALGTAPTRLLDTDLLISGFGESIAGELYVADHSGKVWQIVQG